MFYQYRKTKQELMQNLPADAIRESARLAGVATLRYKLEGGGFGVMYHWTEVIRITEQGITLNSGGYETLTTKERINSYLPAPWRLYQENFVWYLWNHNTDETVEFYDGIVITSPFTMPKKSEA